jgi:hypothetical protein
MESIAKPTCTPTILPAAGIVTDATDVAVADPVA